MQEVQQQPLAARFVQRRVVLADPCRRCQICHRLLVLPRVLPNVQTRQVESEDLDLVDPLLDFALDQHRVMSPD